MSRVDKLDSLLQKEISSIIQFDLNNPEIGFVSRSVFLGNKKVA